MSKRPHADVDKTEEDLNQQFYIGGIGRRRMEVGREMEGLGLPRSIVLPMPVFLKAPYAGTLRPGMEALELGTLATVVQTFQFPSSPAAGAASSIDAAMQDDMASGRDTAPVPDRDTASGQDAAPVPVRDTASGQHEPKIEPGSAHDGSASGQISRDPPPKRRRMVKGGSDPDAYERLPDEDLLDADEETIFMMIQDDDVYQDRDAVPGVRIPRSMPRGAFFQKVIMPWVDENVDSFIAL